MRSEIYIIGAPDSGGVVDTLHVTDACSAQMIMGGVMAESIGRIRGFFTAQHIRDGEVIWEDVIHNLVTTVGKNLVLDAVFAAASSGSVFMGLKGTGSAVVGDTQASHAGWNEVGSANAPTYSGTRKSPTFSAASGSSKTTSSAVAFTFTGSGTVAGCFINVGGTSAIDNTTGTLFSAGDFSGGSRTVASSDVINVTYTVTIT